MIDIDGSVLEGGGQIIRMSVGLSALLKKSIRIYNIRAGRSKPGLKAQHVNGLKLVQKLSGGVLKGAELDSTQIFFEPGDLSENKEQTFEIDVKTAGATTLLAQVSLPVALFREYSNYWTYNTIQYKTSGVLHTYVIKGFLTAGSSCTNKIFLEKSL